MATFLSIQQFTSPGHYQVSVSLKYLRDTLFRYATEHDLEMIPDFQRGHVWTKKQKIAFVEFVLRGGRVPEILFNHPSWMTFNAGDHMVLVDGLQRLTALMAFLDNSLPAFGHLISEYTDPQFLNGIDITFRVNALKTRAEVLQWYLELNSGGTPHTEAELDKVRELIKQERGY